MNRQQRRNSSQEVKRGIGWTRQYSTTRARQQHGVVCLGTVDPKNLSEHWQKRIGYEPETTFLESAEEEVEEIQVDESLDAELSGKIEDEVFDDWSNEDDILTDVYQGVIDQPAKTVIAELKSFCKSDADGLRDEENKRATPRKTVLAAIDKLED